MKHFSYDVLQRLQNLGYKRYIGKAKCEMAGHWKAIL